MKNTFRVTIKGIKTPNVKVEEISIETGYESGFWSAWLQWRMARNIAKQLVPVLEDIAEKLEAKEVA